MFDRQTRCLYLDEEEISDALNSLTGMNLNLEVRTDGCQLKHSLNTSTLIQLADTHLVSIRGDGQSGLLVWISLLQCE